MDPEETAQRSATAMFDADVASRSLGIEIGSIAPGRATVRMRVTDEMVNGHDLCHGGYVFLVADTAFALACNTYGVTTVAAGAEIVFITPARRGDELVAEATERVRYRRSGIYDISVSRTDGEPIAEFRGRSRSLDS
ncbi:MAG: hydroxyphenylacetyl-CoA thioesterase PaaI [Actinomycetota bacterium]